MTDRSAVMSDEYRRAKFAERLLEEKNNQDEVCLWMSFCNPGKPKGQQFTGVIVTKTIGLAHAVKKLWALGINPGGEIFSYETDGSDIQPEHFDRLLTKDDLVAAGYIDP